MNFVGEQIIEGAMLAFEQSPKAEKKTTEIFTSKQEMLYAYLFSDSFSFLKEEEQEIFLYLALLIFKAFDEVNPDIEPISQDAIGGFEEENWEIWNEASGKTFTEKMDPFFLNYPQEDLLALVEDSIIEDEDETDSFQFSKEGKEIMIIGLKTVIDALNSASV